MAGMYFGGADTFASFATGTILVVAIAMLGSLTVLPAVLSKLGDRVNKGRVPFLKPERRTGESRVWSWILDRVLRRPLVSIVAGASVLLVLALPLTHIHTADSGVDGLPRSLAVMQTYDRMQAAFPGEQFTGTIVVEGRQVSREGAGRRDRQAATGGSRVGPVRGGRDLRDQPERPGRHDRRAARRKRHRQHLAGRGRGPARRTWCPR